MPIFLLLFWLATKKVKVSNSTEFLKKRAIVGIIGGIWAEIPDLDYFLEDGAFHNADWGNIFFFHIGLDKVLPDTDLFFAAEMFLVFAVVNLFALALTVESFSRLNEVLFGKEEEEEEDEEEETEAEEGVEGGGKEDEELKEEGKGGEKEEGEIKRGGSEILTREEGKEEEEEGKD